MRQIVHGKNMDVTPALNEYARLKLGKQEGWLEEDGEMHITLSVEGHRREQTVEVTLQVYGFVLRVEETQADMYAAIDLAADRLERRIRKLKEKMRGRQRKVAVAAPYRETGGSDAEAPDVEPYDVVRSKSVLLKPVDLQEAILHMKLLDHDFHLFHNRETDRTELVYKRRDGSFGHITTV